MDIKLQIHLQDGIKILLYIYKQFTKHAIPIFTLIKHLFK